MFGIPAKPFSPPDGSFHNISYASVSDKKNQPGEMIGAEYKR
jgi:hypothetical protein